MRAPVKSFAFAMHQVLKRPCKSIAKRTAWSQKKSFRLSLKLLTCSLAATKSIRRAQPCCPVAHPTRAAREPVEQNNDIFGTTVQLAARLCSHAQPDQILVSTAVAELCIGKGLSFRPLGEVALKGFDRPIQVHAVECAQ